MSSASFCRKLKGTSKRFDAARGITLLELLAAIAIVAILVAVAVPSMRALLTKNHLKAAAIALMEDLQWTRSETIKRNLALRVSFDSSPWCYGIGLASAGACDCALTPGSSGACDIKRRSGQEFPGITLTAGPSETSFEPRRGTSINGSWTLTAENGSALRVVLSRLSRVRICSPSGDVAGYDPC